jgi:D-sedoheptulose 7-phosphate isomerase
MSRESNFRAHVRSYAARLSTALAMPPMERVEHLCATLREAWRSEGTIYLCGNGGSEGNAIHIANDLLHGAGMKNGGGLRVEALGANSAVLTCLANDMGYEEVYAEQLRVKADMGDVLIVLSGSGNSPNVVRALEVGNAAGMTTFAILGFDGGRCNLLAQHSIHFPIDDMQICEDLQLIIGHICMQWLCDHPVREEAAALA